jgi:hypothetical protein
MVPGGPNDSTSASLAHPEGAQPAAFPTPCRRRRRSGRRRLRRFTRDKVGASTQAGSSSRVPGLSTGDVAHDWQYEVRAQVASARISPRAIPRQVSSGRAATCLHAYTSPAAPAARASSWPSRPTAAGTGAPSPSTRTRSTGRAPSPSCTPRTPPRWVCCGEPS